MINGKSPSIIIIGSYVVGLTIRADRFPVAGETLIGRDFDFGPGGKGSNQAVGVTRMGGKCLLMAMLGKDDFSKTAISLYEKEGMDLQYVLQTEKVNTGVAFITLNENGENHIILDVGANAMLKPMDVNRMRDAIQNSTVVMTVLEINPETALRAMHLGQEAGSLTILNPAPARLLPEDIYIHIDVITPNETELRILLGLDPDFPGDVEEMARALQAKGVANVVVTQGSRGALILDRHDHIIHVPGVSVPVVDTTGAGDAFNAGLGVALSEGKTLEEAVRFAVHAGALCCTQLGVIPAMPDRAQVDALMSG